MQVVIVSQRIIFAASAENDHSRCVVSLLRTYSNEDEDRVMK